MYSTHDLFKIIQDAHPQPSTDSLVDACTHSTLLSDKGAILCGECGMEINNFITPNPEMKHMDEWKYSGINDMKHSTDPTRCYVRKIKDKTIYQDLQNMNISDHIKDIANDIYIEVCGDKIHRGSRRKSIVFACVFHAYKLDNCPQSCETLIRIFKIKKKEALKGLKFINDNASKNSPIRTIYITPEHLINEFLQSFKVSSDKKEEIVKLYFFIRDKSATLNRSRPQSVASGVIWYWIRLHQRQINVKEFTKKVDLSELTVTKMAKEVARLCGKEGVV